MMGSNAAYMANFEPFPYQQSPFEDPYEVFDCSYQPVNYSLVSSYLSEPFLCLKPILLILKVQLMKSGILTGVLHIILQIVWPTCMCQRSLKVQTSLSLAMDKV